ncbi:MAG TPA: 3'-5' exonuclease [Pseudomonas xinjiangensis]|uniref:DNA-directed DNA polymerase n=1 Tax=Halopseudomonas xinjiangensis TaxID=487184 RepID=A0A7V1BLW4_9GAMM|nr:3'-5' exonuclease [Halopseudomonas xinjiangensis]HEC49026.1 3'-5' exonuclease [Halopseudomonas xinjiangensis]
MIPLAWLSGLNPAPLTPEQTERRQALPAVHSLDDTALNAARLVVVDVETTGLNVRRDNILSIGAVVIEGGAVDLGSQFERMLYRPNHKVTETVLIHGIAPGAVKQGMPAPDALLDFMEFAGECVFMAFHAPFDRRMLTRGLRQDLGHTLRHRFIDIADLAPMLCPEAKVGRGGLDEWQDYFNLSNSERHNAAADALVTAEIALILLSKARAQKIVTLKELNDRLVHWRRLRQSRSGRF